MAANAAEQPVRGLSQLIDRAGRRILAILLRESRAGQGPHVDPEDPSTPAPSTAGWTPTRWQAEKSVHMRQFADMLRPPGGGSVRDGVLGGDLAEYHQLTADQVVHRCLHWEDESVAEWRASAGTAGGLTEFYDSVTSWSFDLLWFAYLQTVGFAYPNHVVVADRLAPLRAGARVLDFGSGVGVTAQLFGTLGYEVTLADVSAPLLAFARWRLERRGVKASYVHLPAELPPDSYDLITALDTFAHVPDPARAARELHQATRPGGYLVANFDVRRRSERNAWHLHEDDLPLRWAIEQSGYTAVRRIDGRLWVYQARSTTDTSARLRRAGAWLRLASPPTRAARFLRRAGARAGLVTVQWLRGRAA